MKRQSEIAVENAVKALLQTLEQNLKDADVVLDRFEETHDDAECCSSKSYQALIAGHYYLGRAIEKINLQINR